MINLNYILELVILFILTLVFFLLFEFLDYRFDIRIKYFSLVAKNKFIYTIVLIIWTIILFVLLIRCHNYYDFIIIIFLFSIFTSLYQKNINWKMAYDVYIKNVQLLINAKEKDRKKRKKRKNKKRSSKSKIIK